MFCLQEIQINHEDLDKLIVKGWRKMYHFNTNKKFGAAILILTKKTSK